MKDKKKGYELALITGFVDAAIKILLIGAIVYLLYRAVDYLLTEFGCVCG